MGLHDEVRLPFGKYRGQSIRLVATEYVNWLIDSERQHPRMTLALRAELRRRAESICPIAGGLPQGKPRTVCGIDLDEIATGRFDLAVRMGELLMTLDLPVSSLLPEAWRRWCALTGHPHRVRAADDLPAPDPQLEK